VSAFQADAPKRLAHQIIALAAMEFVMEIFEIYRAAVARTASIEAASRFRYR
jgi:hypothetical protein